MVAAGDRRDRGRHGRNPYDGCGGGVCLSRGLRAGPRRPHRREEGPMADGDPEGGGTAIGRALALLGDRWVLLILHRAFALRIRTYAGFRNSLPISESVLAGRLKEMVV